MTASRPSLALALAALGLAWPARAAAQEPGALHACYVPPSGVVYMIGAPGAPRDCLEDAHVGFSWLAGDVAAGAAARVGRPEQPGGGAGGNGTGAGGGAPTVPAGAVVFFEAAICPSGWTEFAPAQGRTIVGAPAGGTIGGSVGDALGDLEDRPHTHTVAAGSWTTTSAGAHAHETPELRVETNRTGDHTHVWATKTSGSNSEGLVWRDGRGRELVDWGDGVGTEGDGQYPISTSEWGALTLYTSTAGAHSHLLTVPALTSSEGGAHDHAVELPERTTQGAPTSSVMPYVQLLACRKS